MNEPSITTTPIPPAGAAANGEPESLLDYANECFLCRRTMGNPLQKTKEDVIPKWLAKLAGLATTFSTLPSGQKFRYTQRVVPCCIECNQFMSATLEAPVSAAFKQGFQAVAALPKETLTLWLAKVFYGTRWRELALRVNTADPDSPTFITPDVLTGTTEYLRQLLLSGPEDVAFVTPPASVFLYRAGVPSDPAYRFDFMVSSEADVIAIRCGDVFVVAVFGDNGFWQAHVDGTDGDVAARSMTLHPAQCLEINLQLAAQAARLDFSGRWDFMTLGDGDPALPGGVSRLFASNSSPEDSGADSARLTMAVGAELLRRGFNVGPTEELLAEAAQGRRPSCIFTANGERVIVSCYEFACPALSSAAGWNVLDGPERVCTGCGATSQAI